MCCVVAIRSWCKLHSIHTNGSMIFHQGRGNLPCSAIMKLRGTGKKWPTTSPFRNGQSSTSRCLFTGPVCCNWVLLQVVDLRNVLWHSRRTLLTCAVPALVSSLQVWDGLMCETLNTDNIKNSFSYIQYTLHCLCSMKQFCWCDLSAPPGTSILQTMTWTTGVLTILPSLLTTAGSVLICKPFGLFKKDLSHNIWMLI